MDSFKKFFRRSVSIFAIATSFLVAVKGAGYEFVLDNDEIYDNCPEIPGNNGAYDGIDFSEFNIHYRDGSVSCSGNLTCRWEGVQPTDRIEARAELYKFQHGAWQPPPFTVFVKDYCKKQFQKSSISYHVWTRHIPENERKCLSTFGHTYHHRPFKVDTVFDFVVNMGGRHKIVARMEAFDEQNVKRPKILCFQIFGEFVKVK